MHYELRTEIDIDARPETVWTILMDLDMYADWNPFIISSSGVVVKFERLTNRLQPPGGRAMTFRPVVTVVSENETFEWLGRLGIRGLFDGRHRFDLERRPDGTTHMVHSESFSGCLVRIFRKSLDRQTFAGFEEMNEALKTRCEIISGAQEIDSPRLCQLGDRSSVAEAGAGKGCVPS
ncbi:MAG: SRPBCC domain-containing protein [Actinobacteria bacterium]|nr:SRPBCC domain-containing protein [Actinomycetota bacterium]